MTGHIWLPVPTPEMKKFAKEMNDGRKESGKPLFKIHYNKSSKGKMKSVRRSLGGGCLKGVQGKLYIIVHGNSNGSQHVGATRGSGIMKKYSPDDLAKAAEAEGLKKKFSDIRMYACGSGIAPKGFAPFGQRLAKSFKDLGYDAIKVTGYLGSVYGAAGQTYKKGSNSEFYNEKHRMVMVKEGLNSARLHRASDYKKVF